MKIDGHGFAPVEFSARNLYFLIYKTVLYARLDSFVRLEGGTINV